MSQTLALVKVNKDLVETEIAVLFCEAEKLADTIIRATQQLKEKLDQVRFLRRDEAEAHSCD